MLITITSKHEYRYQLEFCYLYESLHNDMFNALKKGRTLGLIILLNKG